jgi:hypothetical protein
MPRNSHSARDAESPYTAASRLRKNAVVTSLTLDPEAKQLLREMAGPKTLGAFVSGLIRAEQARCEERQRLRELH